MTFLKDEKNRIRYQYHKVILCLFLFFYFITIQASILYNKLELEKGLEVTPVSLINIVLILGIIALIIDLNNHLFWIKEQGEKVFILRKYDTLPLSKKEIYSSKFKIIISNLVTFLIGSIIVYLVALLINSHFIVNIMHNILEILLLILFSTISLLILLVINISQDNKTKREI